MTPIANLVLSKMNNRKHFINTWLTEMPENIGYMEMFDMYEYNINDLKKHGANIDNIKDNLYRTGDKVINYWYEKGGDIVLGMELRKEQEGLVVTSVAKNPMFKGRPPYASDLYNEVLKDTKYHLRIISDEQLSEEGFNIWAKLLQQGHKISIYDRGSDTPGQTLKTINTVQELKKYHEEDTDYRDLQYILSEQSYIAETRAFFNTRRLRELAGTL